MRLKDYTTICSSAPSEVLTAVALRNRHVLLERNLDIVERNLPLLDDFFERHGDHVRVGPPGGGSDRVPARARRRGRRRFCERLAGRGVLLLPGSVYDEPDHVRVGFGRANLPEALTVLESALATPAPA